MNKVFPIKLCCPGEIATPLRLHILSDLHIEHGGFVAPRVDCDVVVVAGDLANGRRMAKAIADLSSQLRKPMLYVPGNHDWYQTDIVRERSSRVQAWQGATHDVRILDDESWTFDHAGTTYRFIGSTWWSAMDWTDDGASGEAAYATVRTAAIGCLNDYKCIDHDGQMLDPEHTRNMHLRSTRFLQQQIAKATASGETPIVVTHFLPSRSSCHAQYRGSLVNAYFANDRADLTTGVPLWIHGHTHSSFDYVLPTGCRVVCNPRGYGRENTEFEPRLVVEISPMAKP